MFRLSLTLLIIICAATANPAQARPNIVFVLTDNQPAQLIGAYGNRDALTPHIDQLAAQGMRFTQAMAANGMCSPTRATLMTGLMPSQHGVHNWLDDAKAKDWPRSWSAIGDFRTLPVTLQQAGYVTAMIGKWHLGQPWEAAPGFEHWITFPEGHTVDFWNYTIIDNGSTQVVKDIHTMDYFADAAVRFIQTQTGQRPFYLQLNLNGPYLNPPSNLGPARNRHYRSFYERNRFEDFPSVAFNENVLHQLADPSVPPFLHEKQMQAVLMHNDRATMANVLSQNSMVDDALGKVVAALDKAGLRDDTLVVFSSDQGNFFGQHGLWEHTVVTSPSNLYETAMNIPLIFSQPGTVPAGAVNDALIGQYALPTTLLRFAGIDQVLENSPGQDFSPMLNGKTLVWTDAAFFEQEETRGMRTAEFAYWERLQGAGEPALFDMLADPGQHRNLAEDPRHRTTVQSMAERLHAYFERFSTPRYDLWKGGVAKGSVIRPGFFKALYGEQWEPVTELLEPFDPAAQPHP